MNRGTLNRHVRRLEAEVTRLQDIIRGRLVQEDERTEFRVTIIRLQEQLNIRDAVLQAIDPTLRKI